jgi:hypothetical protein
VTAEDLRWERWILFSFFFVLAGRVPTVLFGAEKLSVKGAGEKMKKRENMGWVGRWNPLGWNGMGPGERKVNHAMDEMDRAYSVSDLRHYRVCMEYSGRFSG